MGVGRAGTVVLHLLAASLAMLLFRLGLRLYQVSRHRGLTVRQLRIQVAMAEMGSAPLLLIHALMITFRPVPPKPVLAAGVFLLWIAFVLEFQVLAAVIALNLQQVFTEVAAWNSQTSRRTFAFVASTLILCNSSFVLDELFSLSDLQASHDRSWDKALYALSLFLPAVMAVALKIWLLVALGGPALLGDSIARKELLKLKRMVICFLISSIVAGCALVSHGFVRTDSLLRGAADKQRSVTSNLVLRAFGLSICCSLSGILNLLAFPDALTTVWNLVYPDPASDDDLFPLDKALPPIQQDTETAGRPSDAVALIRGIPSQS